MDPAEVVTRHIEAFNAGDLDALLVGLSDDATWVTGTDRFRGVADLEQLFASAFAELSPRLHVESLLVQGDRVACELREDYRVDGDEDLPRRLGRRLVTARTVRRPRTT